VLATRKPEESGNNGEVFSDTVPVMPSIPRILDLAVDLLILEV